MVHGKPYQYRFGEFRLIPSQRELKGPADNIQLSNRAFDVLVELVALHGQLVTKDHLMDTVWCGRIVEDNNLQVHIAAIRRAIGYHGIATVARHGYRFILPVTSIPEE